MTRRPVHPPREWRLSLSLVNAETGRIYGSHPLTWDMVKALWGERRYLTSAIRELCGGVPDTPEVRRAIGYPEHLVKAREEELAHQAQERAAATHEHTGVAGVLEEV